MAIELKHVRDDELNDGVFVCHEFGSDADRDIYPLDDFEKDCI